MVKLEAYVDKKIVEQLSKYIEKGILENYAQAVSFSIMLLVKILKTCEEKNIPVEECFEKIIDFILK